MSARSTARSLLATLAAAVALGACGPTPPQAPFHEAKKLDASTGDISTLCGLAYQVTAFPGDHSHDLANLEAKADTSVRSLASVYARNPEWIYQGETVRQLVVDALTTLHACGLTRAEQTLRRETSHQQD
ncbi:MAG: hypothetical protein JO363_16715 [Solirubrobacterales bacterium]|nr:hypothetical protein [Solirubrobacterales bacterium]